MMDDHINSSRADALLVHVCRELDRMKPMESAMVASAVMKRLAEYLYDMGVEVELSTKSSPE